MPGRPRNPRKPLVYLDWSTFVRAFEGTSLTADAARKRLHEIVWGVANDSNLCFSLTHIWELLHREDVASRREMAAWLDSVPLVWFLSEDEVIKGEIRHAVLDAVQQRRTPQPIPDAPSFLRVFCGWDAVGRPLSNALRNPTITALVDEVGNDANLMRGLGEFRQISVDYARRFYVDRGLVLRQGRSEAEMRAELDARLRAQLEVDAVQAAAELRRDPDSGIYVERGGVIVAPTDCEVRVACGRFPDLTVAPYVFLSDRVTRNMSFDVVRRPNVRSRAFDAQRGDYYDKAHLVGAAYGDVFTCDKRVAARLDGGREILGKAAPITAQGGVASLRQRIVEQLERFG